MSDKQELSGLSRQRNSNGNSSPTDSAKASEAVRRRHVGTTADYVDTTPKILQDSKPSPVGAVDMPSQASEEKAPRVQRPAPARETPPPEASDPSVISIAVKQETLVLAALVMSSLLLASFIFGHKVGYNKYRSRLGDARPLAAMIPAKKRTPSPPQATKATVEKREKQAAEAAKTRPARADTQAAKNSSEVWTLCVISYKITQRSKADDLLRILSKAIPNQKVFLKRSDNAWTVCVGYFPGSKDAQLTSLRDTIRKMIYQGKPHFGDCYPMRLQG